MNQTMAKQWVRYVALMTLLLAWSSNAPAADEGAHLYVAPEGKDVYDGLAARPESGSRGPVATLTRAIEIAAAQKQQNAWPAGGVTIHIAEGVYVLNSTVKLDGQFRLDENAPLRIAGPTQGQAILRGSLPAGQFAPLSPEQMQRVRPEAAPHIQVARVAFGSETPLWPFPVLGGSQASYGPIALFVDDQFMPLAGWPNFGYSIVGASPMQGLEWEAAEEATFFYEDERPAQWTNLSTLRLHGYWSIRSSADSYVAVLFNDPSERFLTLSPTLRNWPGVFTGQPWRAVNLLIELDMPGEYFVDTQKNLLFFWPPEGADLSSARLSALRDPLVALDGVSNVHLRNLTFQEGAGRGLMIAGSNSVHIEECVFERLGAQGLVIRGGDDFVVEGCRFDRLGQGGLWLQTGDFPKMTGRGTRIERCVFQRCGHWVHSAVALLLSDDVGTTVRHCRFDTLAGGAIGGTTCNALFEKNDFFQLGLEYVGSGISLNGNFYNGGVRILSNYFHDIWTDPQIRNSGILLNNLLETTVSGNVFEMLDRPILISSIYDGSFDENLIMNCLFGVQVQSHEKFRYLSPVDEPTRWADTYIFPSFNQWAEHGEHAARLKRFPRIQSFLDSDTSLSFPTMQGTSVSGNYVYDSNHFELQGIDLSHVSLENNRFRLKFHSPAVSVKATAPEGLDASNDQESTDVVSQPEPRVYIVQTQDGKELARFDVRDAGPGSNASPAQNVISSLSLISAGSWHGDESTKPAEVQLILENRGRTRASGGGRMYSAPVDAAQIVGASSYDYDLAPGESITLTFPVKPLAPVPAVYVGEWRTGESFSRSRLFVPVALHHEIPRLGPISLDDLRQTLEAKGRSGSFQLGNREIATFHLGICDQALAICIQVRDLKIQRKDEDFWTGSMVEVFGAMPDRDDVGQIVFLPPTGEMESAVRVYAGGARQPDAPIERSYDTDWDGYVLSALIPLELLKIDPDTDSLRLELAVGAISGFDLPHARMVYFRSKAAYFSPESFGVFYLTDDADHD